MAQVVGDIIQLVLSGRYALQDWENVFFYRIEDTPTEGVLSGIIEDFQTDVLPSMAAVQNPSTSYLQLAATNIFSHDEAVVSPLDITAGTNSSDEIMASFISASIKLVRSNARVRHGRKSLVGMSEGDAFGQVWTSGYQALLQDCADTFAALLTPGGVDNLAPVIVGRVFVPADPPDIPRAYYRLPETQVEMGTNWAYVSSAIASTLVTSQNSRKQGHGS